MASVSRGRDEQRFDGVHAVLRLRKRHDVVAVITLLAVGLTGVVSSFYHTKLDEAPLAANMLVAFVNPGGLREAGALLWNMISVPISAVWLERISEVDHAVKKSLRPVESLCYGPVWIRDGADEAQGEVLVDLPVGVRVEFKSEI